MKISGVVLYLGRVNSSNLLSVGLVRLLLLRQSMSLLLVAWQNYSSILSLHPRSPCPNLLHSLHMTRFVLSTRLGRVATKVKWGSFGSLLSASFAECLACAKVNLSSLTVATFKYFNKPSQKLLSRRLSVQRTLNCLQVLSCICKSHQLIL